MDLKDCQSLALSNHSKYTRNITHHINRGIIVIHQGNSTCTGCTHNRQVNEAVSNIRRMYLVVRDHSRS